MNVSDTVIGAVIAAIAVMIGALISVCSTYFLEKQKQVAESRRLALAFQGEIRALLGLIKRRKYLEGFRWAIEEMESTQKVVPINIQVRREYFPVFKNNVGSIGLLACPLPELIAQFYVQANSVLEDLESHRDGTLGDAEISFIIYNVKEMAELLQETLKIGEEIIKEVTQLYPARMH